MNINYIIVFCALSVLFAPQGSLEGILDISSVRIANSLEETAQSQDPQILEKLLSEVKLIINRDTTLHPNIQDNDTSENRSYSALSKRFATTLCIFIEHFGSTTNTQPLITYLEYKGLPRALDLTVQKMNIDQWKSYTDTKYKTLSGIKQELINSTTFDLQCENPSITASELMEKLHEKLDDKRIPLSDKRLEMYHHYTIQQDMDSVLQDLKDIPCTEIQHFPKDVIEYTSTEGFIDTSHSENYKDTTEETRYDEYIKLWNKIGYNVYYITPKRVEFILSLVTCFPGVWMIKRCSRNGFSCQLLSDQCQQVRIRDIDPTYLDRINAKLAQSSDLQ